MFNCNVVNAQLLNNSEAIKAVAQKMIEAETRSAEQTALIAKFDELVQYELDTVYDLLIQYSERMVGLPTTDRIIDINPNYAEYTIGEFSQLIVDLAEGLREILSMTGYLEDSNDPIAAAFYNCFHKALQMFEEVIPNFVVDQDRAIAA